MADEHRLLRHGHFARSYEAFRRMSIPAVRAQRLPA
jgi:hypothetical protein